MDQKIIKSGVIGFPISHSLSPRIHNFWLKKYNISGSYEAIEVRPEDLENFINKLGKNGFKGINITLPHKERALSFVDKADQFAKFLGAINTVVVDDSGVSGTNTDFLGFAQNLKSSAPGFDFSRGKAVIIGGGGAARAVLFALTSLKVPEIIATNRTREKAEEIKQIIVENFRYPAEKIKVVDWENRSNALEHANLLVNATSLGMKGQPPLEIDLSFLPKDALVTDIVYNPLETELLKQARERGNKTVDGLGMLLHQAAPGFEAWFGIKPEVTEELRNHVLEAMK